MYILNLCSGYYIQPFLIILWKVPIILEGKEVCISMTLTGVTKFIYCPVYDAKLTHNVYHICR